MYEITPYTFAKAREIGVTVRPSHDRKKKLDVYRNGVLIASVGAIGYLDYPHYLETKGKAYADERRRLYYIRHPRNTQGELLAKILLW